MDLSYNTVVGDIGCFFNNHIQVKQFINTQTWEYQSHSNVYPTVILVPQLSRVNGSELLLNFNLFVCDILNSDRSNTRDVYSDTLDICRDFISYFHDNPELEWNINDDCTLQPWEEKLDDVIGCWILNFTVSLPFHRSICDIPLETE